MSCDRYGSVGGVPQFCSLARIPASLYCSAHSDVVEQGSGRSGAFTLTGGPTDPPIPHVKSVRCSFACRRCVDVAVSCIVANLICCRFDSCTQEKDTRSGTRLLAERARVCERCAIVRWSGPCSLPQWPLLKCLALASRPRRGVLTARTVFSRSLLPVTTQATKSAALTRTASRSPTAEGLASAPLVRIPCSGPHPRLAFVVYATRCAGAPPVATAASVGTIWHGRRHA